MRDGRCELNNKLGGFGTGHDTSFTSLNERCGWVADSTHLRSQRPADLPACTRGCARRDPPGGARDTTVNRVFNTVGTAATVAWHGRDAGRRRGRTSDPNDLQALLAGTEHDRDTSDLTRSDRSDSVPVRIG